MTDAGMRSEDVTSRAVQKIHDISTLRFTWSHNYAMISISSGELVKFLGLNPVGKSTSGKSNFAVPTKLCIFFSRFFCKSLCRNM